MDQAEEFISRAEYARLRGWDRSYVTQLQKAGRLVMSACSELVDWKASDKKIKETADPSKVNVKKRWQEQRVEKHVYGYMNEFDSTEPVADASSAFQAARANKEFYAGELARVEFEWVTGLLVSRMRVEDAAHTLGRHFRDRIMGLPTRIAPELASITDAWELEQYLNDALRRMLEDVIGYGEEIIRNAIEDTGRGKLSELSRMGRERYGQPESS